LPEALRSLIARVRSRRRLQSIAAAMSVGGASFAAILIAATAMHLRMDNAIAAAALLGGLAATAVVISRWRSSDVVIAETIEAADGTLDNLIATAAELQHTLRPVRADIRDAIFGHAAERAADVDAAAVIPLMQPFGVATAIAIGCVLLVAIGGESPLTPSRFGVTAPIAAEAAAITVRVTPPAYTKRAAESHSNPIEIAVLAGSEVRIDSGSRVLREWRATASESLELRDGSAAPARFLSVTVIPDAPPSVRVIEPGRDTAFAAATVTLAIGVESRDDLGLASLALRYTKASGGGENVTFSEGEVPLDVERLGDRHWRARAQWPLATLGLADGDVLVYRAVARDANPSALPVESDAFLVEIGRTAEIASAGFALPTEERKYAISQQMVIYKTEQLVSAREKNVLEESRLIGMEQRMVRAEVVFLSGGEIEDEVVEAAHSHELAEGRLENQGRAEMIRAINLMSRAEAQLNDGNPAAALPLERQALASLERALDRRRYFLRTLPDRSRIELTRRLTGERREARSWVRGRDASTTRAADRPSTLMGELMAAAADDSRIDASLAARVATVDAQSPELQKAAVGMATAATPDQRRAAVDAAMRALTAHVLKTRPGSWPVVLPADPLAGRLGEALPTTRPRQ
jgi:hypothetical protein